MQEIAALKTELAKLRPLEKEMAALKRAMARPVTWRRAGGVWQQSAAAAIQAAMRGWAARTQLAADRAATLLACRARAATLLARRARVLAAWRRFAAAVAAASLLAAAARGRTARRVRLSAQAEAAKKDTAAASLLAAVARGRAVRTRLPALKAAQATLKAARLNARCETAKWLKKEAEAKKLEAYAAAAQAEARKAADAEAVAEAEAAAEAKVVKAKIEATQAWAEAEMQRAQAQRAQAQAQAQAQAHAAQVAKGPATPDMITTSIVPATPDQRQQQLAGAKRVAAQGGPLQSIDTNAPPRLIAPSKQAVCAPLATSDSSEDSDDGEAPRTLSQRKVWLAQLKQNACAAMQMAEAWQCER